MGAWRSQPLRWIQTNDDDHAKGAKSDLLASEQLH